MSTEDRIDMDAEPGLLDRIRESHPDLYHGIMLARAKKEKRLAAAARQCRIEADGDPMTLLPQFVEELRRRMTDAEAEIETLKTELVRVKKEAAEATEAVNARLSKAGKLVKALDERTRPKAAQPRR